MHRLLAKWLTTGKAGENIVVESIAEYKTHYELDDLPDDGLITKYNLQSYFGPTLTPVSYELDAGEPLLQFIPNTGGFDELARLIVIDTVELLRVDITTPTLHYDGVSGNFDGWNVSLPVQDDGNFNTANPCVVWVKE